VKGDVGDGVVDAALAELSDGIDLGRVVGVGGRVELDANREQAELVCADDGGVDMAGETKANE